MPSWHLLCSCLHTKDSTEHKVQRFRRPCGPQQTQSRRRSRGGSTESSQDATAAPQACVPEAAREGKPSFVNTLSVPKRFPTPHQAMHSSTAHRRSAADTADLPLTGCSTAATSQSHSFTFPACPCIPLLLAFQIKQTWPGCRMQTHTAAAAQ